MAHEHAVPSTDRATMLITCPANAPSWAVEGRPASPGEIEHRRLLGLRHDEAYIRDLHARQDKGVGDWSETWGFLMTVDEEMSIWRVQAQLSEAAAIAEDYLDRLPGDQAGGVRLDSARGAVVVQVTRDADRVRAELQEEVGDVAVIVMEIVRFSKDELELIAGRIQRLEGLGVTSIGAGGGNGRVDVTVSGDPDEARLLIEEVADPCSFAVTHGSRLAFGLVAADRTLATIQSATTAAPRRPLGRKKGHGPLSGRASCGWSAEESPAVGPDRRNCGSILGIWAICDPGSLGQSSGTAMAGWGIACCGRRVTGARGDGRAQAISGICSGSRAHTPAW